MRLGIVSKAGTRMGRCLLPLGWALVAVTLGLLVARVAVIPLALGLGAALVLVGTLVEPLVGVGAALVLGLLRAWLEIRAPGATPHIGQAVLVVALAAWVAQGLLRRSFYLSVPVSFLPLFLFIGVALLSLWAPVSPWDGALELVKWAQMALVAFLVYDRIGRHMGNRALDTRWVVGVLAASALFQAVTGLWQFGLLRLGALKPIEIEAFAINARFSRAYGSFQQPNPYGGYLGLMSALLVGITLSLLVDRWRSHGASGALTAAAWWGIPALVVVAGLVASWSRGGWMGFGAAMLAMAAMLPRRGWWGPVLLAGLLGVGVLAFVLGLLPAAMVERLGGFLAYTRFEDVRGVGVTDANYAVVERMAHWQAALDMWRDHFWLGIGLGGYEAAYPAYRLINWVEPLGHAHNTYLNMLAEGGVLGLCAYLVWLGFTALRLVAALMSRDVPGDPWRRALALGLIGAWTHFAIHGLVDSLLVNNVHLHVGVLVALSVWVSDYRLKRVGEVIPQVTA